MPVLKSEVSSSAKAPEEGKAGATEDQPRVTTTLPTTSRPASSSSLPRTGPYTKKLPILTFDNIKVGGIYDVLDHKGRWCEGEIMKIDRPRGRVYISYVYWESSYDEWIDDISRRLVLKHTHTYDEGRVLKTGQRVEAMDERQEWLEAFIVDENEAQVKVHFRGFSEKFDQWVPRDKVAGKIRPYGRDKFFLGKTNRARPKSTLFSVPGMRGENNGSLSNVPSSLTMAAAMAANMPESEKENLSGKFAANEMVPSTSAARIRGNDDDERTRKIADMSDQFMQYVRALEAQRLAVIRVSGDGNCLFRAVAHQIYGDESLHHIVRQKCMDYMECEADFFSQFVVGGREHFHLYLAAKRMDGCWGDDPEIEAICELYNRPAEIWAYDATRGARKLRTFHESSVDTALEPSTAVDASSPRAAAMLTQSTLTQTQGGNGNNSPLRHPQNNSGDNNNHRATSSSNQPEDRVHNRRGGNNQRGEEQEEEDYAVIDPADDDSPVANNRHMLSSSMMVAPEPMVMSPLPSSRAPAVMRLSYYGGGHYDSIVDMYHRENLLRIKPGDTEDMRIEHSRSGLINHSTHRTYRHSMASATSADTATATTLSRSEQDDIETCLLLSMQAETMLEKEEGDLLQSVAAESEREYLEQVMMNTAREGEMNVEDEILQATLRDSALEAQSKDEMNLEDIQDKDVALALKLSTLSEEEALELALQQSMMQNGNSSNAATADAKGQQFSSNSGSKANLDQERFKASSKATQYDQDYGAQSKGSGYNSNNHSASSSSNNNPFTNMDEDALLQQALAESLRCTQSSSSSSSSQNRQVYQQPNNGHASNQHSQQSNGNQPYDDAIDMNMAMAMGMDEDYDEELMRAIQESLRK